MAAAKKSAAKTAKRKATSVRRAAQSKPKQRKTRQPVKPVKKLIASKRATTRLTAKATPPNKATAKPSKRKAAPKKPPRAPQPPPPVDPRFAKIVTLADLKKNESRLNKIFGDIDKTCPADSYFDVKMLTGYFYHDQQGCGSWFLTKEGKVGDDYGGQPTDSVPIFLTKLAREQGY